MASPSEVVAGARRWLVETADALFALSSLPDNSVDAIVTDPPYGLGGRHPPLEDLLAYLQGAELDTGGDFMGHNWSIPSVAIWRECARILKPGGHLATFGGTRTFDLIGLGCRAAGLELRDSIGVEGTLRWLYAEGMPKSHNVSKAIDKRAGAKRRVTGAQVLKGRAAQSTKEKGGTYTTGAPSSRGAQKPIQLTEAETLDAVRWEGWGTALRPSWEPVLLFRKPFGGTVAANVLAHGTGGLHIDACRIPRGGDLAAKHASAEGIASPRNKSAFGDMGSGPRENNYHPGGGWPANTVLCHTPDCTADRCHSDCAVVRLGSQSGERKSGTAVRRNGGGGKIFNKASRQGSQPDAGYADEGDASRFFNQIYWDRQLDTFHFCAKAQPGDRVHPDVPGVAHPTVKPRALIGWLIRLGVAPGGLIVDPYLGSGTTGVAALAENAGYRFLGFDRDPAYVALAAARIRHAAGGNWVPREPPTAPDGQRLLF